MFALEAFRAGTPDFREPTAGHALRHDSLNSIVRQLLKFTSYLAFTPLRKARTSVRTVVTCVERGFAAFAKIPYQDALTHRNLSELLDEYASESHSEHADWHQ
jgi:hypothetical protein